MQLSVFYHHVHEAAGQSGVSLPAMLEQLRRWGVTGVYADLPTLLGDLPGHVRLLGEAGITVDGIYGLFRWEQTFDPAGAERLVDTAALFHTDNVLVVPGFLPREEADRLRRAQTAEDMAAFLAENAAVQQLRRGLEYTVGCAGQRGITVSLEDYDGWTAPYSRIGELQWWMEAVPGLRYTLDIGNFAFSDEDAAEACRTLRSSICHVHCKDRAADPGVRGRHTRGLLPCAVGDGYLPTESIVSYLKATGYSGGLTIEHFDVPDYSRAIRRSAEYLRGIR